MYAPRRDVTAPVEQGFVDERRTEIDLVGMRRRDPWPPDSSAGGPTPPTLGSPSNSASYEAQLMRGVNGCPVPERPLTAMRAGG